MNRYLIAVAVCLFGCFIGCNRSEPIAQRPTTALASVEASEIGPELGPLPAVPSEPTNRYADDDKVAAFGQRLFFEKSYAGPLVVGDDGKSGGLGKVGDTGKVACASCHDPHGWFVETRPTKNVSIGVNYTNRNVPSLVNIAFYRWFSWGGKEDSIWMQGAQGSESPVNFGSNRLVFAHVIFAKYRHDYDALFPTPLDPALDPSAPDASRFPNSGMPKADPSQPNGPWEKMAPADQEIVNTISANCGKALEAYERRLVSRNAPLDRYLAGDETALSASAKRGLELFTGKAQCTGCHTGPLLSDNDFHVIGVAQNVGPHVPRADNGRYDDAKKTLSSPFNGAGVFSDDRAAGAAKLSSIGPTNADIGKFRTASLRQVAQTAPYMHNGSLATLEDVVAFYSVGGRSSGFAGVKDPKITALNLTGDEQRDLVAFLREGLTGDPVESRLMVDTSAP